MYDSGNILLLHLCPIWLALLLSAAAVYGCLEAAQSVLVLLSRTSDDAQVFINTIRTVLLVCSGGGVISYLF